MITSVLYRTTGTTECFNCSTALGSQGTVAERTQVYKANKCIEHPRKQDWVISKLYPETSAGNALPNVLREVELINKCQQYLWELIMEIVP